MRLETIAYFAILILILGLFILAGSVSAAPGILVATPQPMPTPGRSATAGELAQAEKEWKQSAHADTFDDGMGANTTCAKCKSPTNWNPQAEAVVAAQDCASCKRIPGAPRPELSGGVPVARGDWANIGCSVCHQPFGDSYSTSIAFWNQAIGQYEAVSSVTELCTKCHEGRHGFEVVEEQAASISHKGWDCTRCHGPHGEPARCTDCHDPAVGKGVEEHTRHTQVNCTACHDAGGLSVWKDSIPGSRHLNEYITLRFAHTLTSWPSHDISREVRCQRCHHPAEKYQSPLVSNVSCEACHPDGASLFWCEYFSRNPDPIPTPVQGVK